VDMGTQVENPSNPNQETDENQGPQMNIEEVVVDHPNANENLTEGEGMVELFYDDEGTQVQEKRNEREKKMK